MNEANKNQQKLTEKKTEKYKSLEGNVVPEIVIILILIIFLLAVFFNIFVVEMEKYKTRKAIQKQEEITAELKARLEKIKEELAKKSAETSELISFNDKFTPVLNQYFYSINEISDELEDKPNNLNDIIILTNKRIDAAKKYLNDFEVLETPEILKNFYDINLSFIESDIKLWEVILSYYNLKDLSKFDTKKIDELKMQSNELYKKAILEFENVYKSYGLEYFLNDYE